LDKQTHTHTHGDGFEILNSNLKARRVHRRGVDSGAKMSSISVDADEVNWRHKFRRQAERPTRASARRPKKAMGRGDLEGFIQESGMSGRDIFAWKQKQREGDAEDRLLSQQQQQPERWSATFGSVATKRPKSKASRAGAGGGNTSLLAGLALPRHPTRAAGSKYTGDRFARQQAAAAAAPALRKKPIIVAVQPTAAPSQPPQQEGEMRRRPSPSQPGGGEGLTAEQRATMERNRAAALERRRQKQAHRSNSPLHPQRRSQPQPQTTRSPAKLKDTSQPSSLFFRRPSAGTASTPSPLKPEPGLGAAAATQPAGGRGAAEVVVAPSAAGGAQLPAAADYWRQKHLISVKALLGRLREKYVVVDPTQALLCYCRLVSVGECWREALGGKTARAVLEVADGSRPPPPSTSTGAAATAGGGGAVLMAHVHGARAAQLAQLAEPPEAAAEARRLAGPAQTKTHALLLLISHLELRRQRGGKAAQPVILAADEFRVVTEEQVRAVLPRLRSTCNERARRVLSWWCGLRTAHQRSTALDASAAGGKAQAGRKRKAQTALQKLAANKPKLPLQSVSKGGAKGAKKGSDNDDDDDDDEDDLLDIDSDEEAAAAKPSCGFSAVASRGQRTLDSMLPLHAARAREIEESEELGGWTNWKARRSSAAAADGSDAPRPHLSDYVQQASASPPDNEDDLPLFELSPGEKQYRHSGAETSGGRSTASDHANDGASAQTALDLSQPSADDLASTSTFTSSSSSTSSSTSGARRPCFDSPPFLSPGLPSPKQPHCAPTASATATSAAASETAAAAAAAVEAVSNSRPAQLTPTPQPN
jgi:hypothetical protein